jgi:hypothetical protein
MLWRVLSLVLVLALAAPWVVWADNVNNDVTVGGSDTFTLGDSTTVGYKVVANSGDGQTGCNASDGSTATVTINTPAQVTATPGSLEFDACNIFKNVVFTASAAGSYIITVNVADEGAGSYHTTPATFTLKVLPATTADTTPPVITPNVSGTLGNNDWYVSDVTVSWTVTDDESTITSQSGCDDVTVDYDTAGVTFTCEATSAGGTASESVTIKRDATDPTVGLVGGPADGASYYFGFVPAAPTCIASDAMSGLEGPCSVSGYSAAVGTHTVTASVSDLAGNSASDSRSYTVKDWSFGGFYRPVDMGDVWNTVKGGSTVPLKYNFYIDDVEVTDTSIMKFSALQVACPGETELVETPVELTTTGGTSLRYDAVAMQFVQNWQTPKRAKTCWTVTVVADGGPSLSAQFMLK